MVTTTNNPDLVKLIGMKLHVRDIQEFDDYPKPYRDMLKAHALNADMFVHSIVFNADTPPDIGLVQDMDNPDDMEYYKPWQLVFSAPTGSSQPLPVGLFHNDGSVVALIHQQRSEAA